jgi:hypothetical protein
VLDALVAYVTATRGTTMGTLAFEWDGDHTIEVKLVGQAIASHQGGAALIVDGQDRSDIDDFKGRSQTRRLPDGRIEIAVQGFPHWGRRNEPLVLKVLRQAFSQETSAAVTMTPATAQQDSRGIDGFLELADRKQLVVQVLSVPIESSYAACLARGDSRIVLTTQEAAGWMFWRSTFATPGC